MTMAHAAHDSRGVFVGVAIQRLILHYENRTQCVGLMLAMLRRKRMKEIVAWIFEVGLLGNAALFVPQIIAVWRKKSDEGVSLLTFGGFNILQAIGIVHGFYQDDRALKVGMTASIITCGTVTGLTLVYRARRLRAAQSQL
jgi:MtN3 and saliva related transmembrane protein